MKNVTLLLVSLLCLGVGALAQNTEKQLVRKGNKLYAEGKYDEAEARYREAVSANPDGGLDAGPFNLGNALYRQERYEEAAGRFGQAAEAAKSKEVKAQAYYNKGNSLLNVAKGGSAQAGASYNAEKVKEGIAAYKQALRLAPDDADIRYNLAYAKKLLEKLQQQQQEQQNQEQQNQQQQEQNQEQQQNQEQDQEEQNQNKEQQNQDRQEEEQNQEQEQQSRENQQNQEQQQQEQKQEQGQEGRQQEQDQKDGQEQKGQSRQLTKEEAARLLEALQNEELKVQQKLKKEEGKGGANKPDKDW